MAKKKKGGYVPFTPPPGTYDPSLDAASRASNRGLGDLLASIHTKSTQNYNDVLDPNLGSVAQINYNRDNTIGDLNTNYQNFERDLGRSRVQALQDYQQGKKDLGQQYTRLGDQQAGAARAAGVVGNGGALTQALRKRTANQAQDQGKMDTAIHRQFDAWRTQEGDATQNWRTGVDRAGHSADVGVGQQLLGLSRSSTDLNTQGTIAQRENTAFGADTNAAKLASVAQNAPSYYRSWVDQNHANGYSIGGTRLKKPGRFR